MKYKSIADRLEANSIPEPNSGCLIWIGPAHWKGYGQIHKDGKKQRAHRVAWTLKNGPIPEGLCVLHHCDMPPCINPDHLFIGTQQDNVADMIAKGRRHLSYKVRKKNRLAQNTIPSGR